jgi:tRNA(Ile)-lysidine synthase
MALLHAFARVAPKQVAAVATFDHGTGPAATRATDLVASVATRLGFQVVRGGGRDASPGKRASEAEWREDRMRFLADVAARAWGKQGGVIVTAHTRDDQVETVFMRVLRDSGARGLAALYATSEIVRPLLDCSRAEVAAYVRGVGAEWIEDPTNASMRFLRNRVRHDLLPALARAVPGLEEHLLALARRAAAWRVRVDWLVDKLAHVGSDGRNVVVAVDALASHSPAQLAVLWPAIAARVGLAMDWRGTERAAAFANDGQVGARIQLSRGWEIVRSRHQFELRQAHRPAFPDHERVLVPGVRWGGWRFTATRDAHVMSDEWVAQLPENAAHRVRAWQPGDRMRLGSSAMRKVKRFLSDAHVSGARRGGWPVVLAGDEIVWIPGVRRSDAAVVRPGTPGVVYRCELEGR